MSTSRSTDATCSDRIADTRRRLDELGGLPVEPSHPFAAELNYTIPNAAAVRHRIVTLTMIMERLDALEAKVDRVLEILGV